MPLSTTPYLKELRSSANSFLLKIHRTPLKISGPWSSKLKKVSRSQRTTKLWNGFYTSSLMSIATAMLTNCPHPIINVRLLHHLERENERKHSKHILRVPIGKISDREFQQFGDYLRPLKGPNYLDLMKYFKRAHNIAIRKGLATVPLTYRYMDNTPIKTFEELSAMNKGVASLSVTQIQAVEKLDLSRIVLKCKNNAFYKRLYLDTCLLIFYLYSRPIDILNMKWSNIRKCDKGYYIEYLPIKKKNSANAILPQHSIQLPASEIQAKSK